MRRAAVSRRSHLPILLLVLAVMVFVTFGAFATLAATGVIQLPWLKKKRSLEGLYGYPITSRPVRAYSRVTRDDLLDPKTGELKVFYVPLQNANSSILVDLGKILGRVLKADKPAGYTFTEEDFFEDGTRPGLVAAVPPGKRAIAVNVSKMQGTVFGLSAGDHCDVLATAVLETPKSTAPPTAVGIHTPESALQTQATVEQKKAVVRVLVHDGVVITPATPPQMTNRGRPLPQTRPQQEMILAVDPTEVAPLTEALATNVEIACVARSGRPLQVKELAVPLSSQPLLAYTRITRDYLLDPLTGSMKTVYLRTDSVDPLLVTDPYKIVGRVLAHDKPAGFLFTEDDFLPEGTTAGLVGAIPSGKRALALNRAKVQGLEFGLKAGDHLDLLATVPVDFQRALSHLHVGGTGANWPVLQAMTDPQNKMAVKVLAQNTSVVAPVINRRASAGGRSATDMPEQDIILAVDPAEVAPLTQAVAANLSLMAVTRSGVPSEQNDHTLTPPSAAVLTFSGIEVIQGNKRDMVVFPRMSGSASTK